MPASAGITTRDFMCFIIFWIISLPLIWPPVHTMYVAQPSFRKDHWRTCNSRHFFTFKTIVTPIACLVFMIWCIVKAKGVGPIINQPGTLHGSELAWSMMVGISVCISNMITLTTYAHRAFYYVQIHILHWSQECAGFWVARKESLGPYLFPALVHPLLLRHHLSPRRNRQLIVADNLWLCNLVTCWLASHVFRRQSVRRYSIWCESGWRILFYVDEKAVIGRVYRCLFHYCSGRHLLDFNFIRELMPVFLRWGMEKDTCYCRDSCFIRSRTNISANSVSAGCDLTALFPRFIVNHLPHILVQLSNHLHYRT